MELILQIAFGIVLGFLLIVYHQKLLVLSKKAAVLAVALASVGAVGFGAYIAYERISANPTMAPRIAKFQTETGSILEFEIPNGYSKEQAEAYAAGIEIGMKESVLRARFEAEEAAKTAIDPGAVVWDKPQAPAKPWERDWASERPSP